LTDALKALEKEITRQQRAAARPNVAGIVITLGIVASFAAGWFVQERIAALRKPSDDKALLKLDWVASLAAAQQRIAELEAERRPTYWYQDLDGLTYRSPVPANIPSSPQ
jgi:hypothetical protein